MKPAPGRYYISVGQQEHFYTLRYLFQELVWTRADGRPTSFLVERDYHVQNLAHDKQAAIDKALEITGQTLKIDYDKSPGQRRTVTVDPSIIRFGQKHCGKSIHAVQQEDPDYLVWAAENMTSKNHEATLELIKSLMKHQLDSREEERQQTQAAEEAECQRVASLVEEIAVALQDGKGGFRDSVAKELAEGRLPAGRGLNIVVDILAKENGGRRNSKAYKAERARLWEVLDQVIEPEEEADDACCRP